MRIHLASDHAGFELKTDLFLFLKERGYDVVDHGPAALSPEDDYPLTIEPAVRSLHLEGEEQSKAIIIGGSGQGEAIAANRIVGIRAAVYYGGPLDIIKLSREHNNANVLSLGARFMTLEEAREAVSLWLQSPFSGEERHARRIEEIDIVARR